MPFYQIEVKVTTTKVYILRGANPEHAAQRFINASTKERHEFFSHDDITEAELNDDDVITVEQLTEDLHPSEILLWGEGLLLDGKLTTKQWQGIKAMLLHEPSQAETVLALIESLAN